MDAVKIAAPRCQRHIGRTRHMADDGNELYKVVVNEEEQYSLWPDGQEAPLGWKPAGKTGTKEECMAYVKEVWTDMRPLSLRRKMEQMARGE
ncbi:MbtH family protein [Streptomyces sp. NPDC004646]